jgi:hypothetical protein
MRCMTVLCLLVAIGVNGIATAQERAAAIKYVNEYVWSILSQTDLTAPGTKTVTLSACPQGVKGDEPEFWIYISGTGSPETVKVTGGSCNGDGKPGTLQFTTSGPKPAGYQLSSASDGLQEALIAGRFTPTNPPGKSQSGKIIVSPGEYRLHARVSIRASNQTIDLSGSILECYMDDSCIFVGDPANSNAVMDVTLVNPRGRPMVPNGTRPFIEANGQKTRIYNVSTRVSKTGTFGAYVQVDDDQGFLLDGLSAGLGNGVRCDATFCGSYVTAPGPFNKWSAVGWLKHLNLSPQCQGNGVDWQSGNTLRISDSVVQGYNQFGVRTGIPRGGYGPSALENVYMEAGNCKNKLGNIGAAGVIAMGQRLSWSGGEGPQGKIPLFADTGKKDYRYYIIPHHAKYGYGNPLYAGKALSSGVGNISVTTPDITGADRFDLLRVTPHTDGREQAPYGTGNFAVARDVARDSACSEGLCTFTDSQTTLSSYTVAAVTYFPKISFWPGDFVLGSSGDTSSAFGTATLAIDELSAGVVSVAGASKPVVFAESCTALKNWSPAWIVCESQSYPPSAFYEQGSLVMAVKPNNDGGAYKNLKGRINFSTLGTGPGHIITLSDSSFEKTIATANNRPTSDVNDAFIGYDYANGNSAQVGISFGAPRSLSNYIGNAGDGENWKERLTAREKNFAVPVVIQDGSTLTLGGGTPISRMDIQHVEVKGFDVPARDCADLDLAVPHVVLGEQIASLTPPAALGNLSVSAYVTKTNTLTLHFCNISLQPTNAPTGRYSFLAVQ